VQSVERYFSSVHAVEELEAAAREDEETCDLEGETCYQNVRAKIDLWSYQLTWLLRLEGS
jgi:hypothetical protein